MHTCSAPLALTVRDSVSVAVVVAIVAMMCDRIVSLGKPSRTGGREVDFRKGQEQGHEFLLAAGNRDLLIRATAQGLV